MKVYNIDQFIEKLRIEPATIDVFNNKIIKNALKQHNNEVKLQNFVKTHFSNDYVYKLEKTEYYPNGYLQTTGSSHKNIDITLMNDTIMLKNPSHRWGITAVKMSWIYDKFDYNVKFEEHDSIQIRSGGKSHCVPFSKLSIQSFSESNVFDEINFCKIEFDTSFVDLLKHVWVKNLYFTNCQIPDQCLIDLIDVLPTTKNKDVTFCSDNSNTLYKFRKYNLPINLL